MQPQTVPHTLKEKQRQERERLILRAAEDMFLEKGYHETSIDEIATRVGIAKGTVYLHFPSKEDLIFALVERDSQRMLDNIEAHMAEVTSIREKLEAIFRTIYSSYFDQRLCIPYLINNSADLHRLFMEKKSSMHNKWDQISALVRSLLDEGKTSGEFDSALPTLIMQHAFFSLLSPRSYERLIIEQHMSSDEVVGHLCRLYFKSIASAQGE